MESSKRADRLERILALLERIGDGAHINADGLAEEFSVSRRTVFRDIQLLRKAGVKIRIDYPREGYELQLPNAYLERVSDDDLQELLTHARYSIYPRNQNQNRGLDHAIRCLAKHLPNERQEQIQRHVVSETRCGGEFLRSLLDTLTSSIAADKPVKLWLRPVTSYPLRVVEVAPLRVEHFMGTWRLSAVVLLNHQTVVVHLNVVESIEQVSATIWPPLSSELKEWTEPKAEIIEQIKPNGLA